MKSFLLSLVAASALWLGAFTMSANAQYIGVGGYGGYAAPRAYNSYYRGYAPGYYAPGYYPGTAYPRYGYPNGAYGNYPMYQSGYGGNYYAPRYYPARPVYGGGFYRPGVRVGIGF